MPPPEADQLDAEKRALREAVRAQIASISPTEAARRSRAICQAIAATGAFARARTIMAYLPIEDGPLEVDPRQLGAIAIARGKRLCYPRMDWDRKTMQPIVVPSALPRAEVRRHNVPEPTEGATVDAAEVDLVIVPGVAFDAARHRLGRGGGFYDRFLTAWRAARAKTPGIALGIGFAEQIVGNVPRGAHDVRLDGIASDVGVWVG